MYLVTNKREIAAVCTVLMAENRVTPLLIVIQMLSTIIMAATIIFVDHFGYHHHGPEENVIRISRYDGEDIYESETEMMMNRISFKHATLLTW
jgi:predicted metallo-beta-lactamase superfamily hydrolase